MPKFKLDERLNNDCIVLGKFKTSQLLLMNNSLVPWFILVPEVEATELFELEHSVQDLLSIEINQLSEVISAEYSIDKLNVAAIGNIVNQLHIHVIGRNKQDFCWPNVVWGVDQKELYSKNEIEAISVKMTAKLNLQPIAE